MHKDDVARLWRGRRSGGGALDKSACRSRSHHAYEGASIHWVFLPKIVLAIHGSSPLRKIRVGYWELLENRGKSAGNNRQCSQHRRRSLLRDSAYRPSKRISLSAGIKIESDRNCSQTPPIRRCRASLRCSDGGISGSHSLLFGSVRKNGITCSMRPETRQTAESEIEFDADRDDDD